MVRVFSLAIVLRKKRGPQPRRYRLLARAFNRTRALHRLYLTAWVFLPDRVRIPTDPRTRL